MEELDHDLLISCSSGLGSWLEDANGSLVYCKTDDCVGKVKCLSKFQRLPIFQDGDSTKMYHPRSMRLNR